MGASSSSSSAWTELVKRMVRKRITKRLQNEAKQIQHTMKPHLPVDPPLGIHPRTGLVVVARLTPPG
jgi:hypothetical protein